MVGQKQIIPPYPNVRPHNRDTPIYAPPHPPILQSVPQNVLRFLVCNTKCFIEYNVQYMFGIYSRLCLGQNGTGKTPVPTGVRRHDFSKKHD